MRRYTMQDRSGGTVNRTDTDLSLQQTYEMTDYSEQEMDELADLQVGSAMFLGSVKDIYILRTV